MKIFCEYGQRIALPVGKARITRSRVKEKGGVVVTTISDFALLQTDDDWHIVSANKADVGEFIGRIRQDQLVKDATGVLKIITI